MVTQSRTRAQIRQAIGLNLPHGYPFFVRTTTSAGAVGGTTLVDASLPGGDDEWNGKWIVITSGTNAGEIRRVSDYTASTTTITVGSAFTGQVASGVTFELWSERFYPGMVNDAINAAIGAATGLWWVPQTDYSLHATGRERRYALPSGVDAVKDVELRSLVTAKTLHSCETAWSESVDSDVTAVADDEDFRRGAAALKLTVAAGASANDLLATSAITSADLSRYDYIEFWAKSTVAAAAADLQLLLDNTASCVSPLESLSLPALTADAWKYCRVALANPELDTAIISVGLKYVTDLGACVLWLDDIKAVADRSAQWERLDRRDWIIDQENNELVLRLATAPYALVRLVGGAKPTLLSADSTTSDCDPEYLAAQATGLLLSALPGGERDPDGAQNKAGYWLGRANQIARGFPLVPNLRLS